MLLRFIQFQVGEGSRVRFWQDLWCGGSSLVMCFPELFRISCDKEASEAGLRIRGLIKFYGFHIWQVGRIRCVGF